MNGMEVMKAHLKACAPMELREIAAAELRMWLAGSQREAMMAGGRYYQGQNDICRSHRMVIGRDGKPERAVNVADNRLCHAFLSELTDQKVQYLLGKPMSLHGEQEMAVRKVLGDDFQHLLAETARDAVNKGLGWLYVYPEGDGLHFMRMEPEEMCPLWEDRGHTRLGGMLRLYAAETFAGRKRKVVHKAELWTRQGVQFFFFKDGRLEADPERKPCAMVQDAWGRGYCWEQLPFIPLKYNAGEKPLLSRIKSLVDEYDRVASSDSNTLQDQPNAVLVVRNYDGTDLGEFRKNLMAYRAVKVSDAGGLETLRIPLDVDASNKHLERIRRDIYAFGRGVDTRSERFAGNPSGVAMKHAYAQLDMDCNDLERGVQQLFRQVLWFAGVYLGLPKTPQLELVCNRDILISEEAAIAMCRDSLGLLSRRTVLENHPWVGDARKEEARLQEAASAG